ncbi:MAG: DNA primase [Candidatus Pacebacteria bacterium]|nr:DNA primase [Candidatus Paceibacterota bacterium]
MIKPPELYKIKADFIMLSSPVEEIKNRLDIIEVIGGYIKLQKTGANYRAPCPFHAEKKPSFFVSPARQIWHCFGCAAGGDIFKFVMQIEGVEFGDALRILAQKAGVELRPMKAEAVQLRSERQKLYEICELATKFFEKQLEESSTGKEAKKYLLGRKISEESIKSWRLGYAPDVWQGLSDFLNSRNYTKEEIEKAGLGLTSERGSFYDRFRGRIIFPIFDLNSQVVGFGGRVFKDKDNKEIAKYVNTPSTILYDKSRILYGLDKAKLEVRRQDKCVLVEGYVDVIMSSQAGIKNVVATSGTALTPYQLRILKRYSESLWTAFDMDSAGDHATKRGTDLAQTLGFNIKVVTMPQDLDPADVISKDPLIWEKLISEAKPIVNFYFDTTFLKFDSKTPEGKKEISKILLPIIKIIPNQIEKSFWIQELSKKLAVREEDIREEMKKVKLSEDFFELEKEEKIELPQKSRKELLEERLVALLLKSPETCPEFVCEEDLEYFSPKFSEIVSRLRKKEKLEGASEFCDLVNYLSLKAEVETEISGKEIEEEIKDCFKNMKSIDIKKKLDEISNSLREAEGEKNSGKINDLMGKFNKLAQKLNTI